MKLFWRIFLIGTLALFLSIFYEPVLLFAAPSQGGAGSETPAAADEKTEAIPGTFSVGEHLTIPQDKTTGGQKSFIPSEKNKEGGIVFIIVRAIDLLIRFIGGVALIVFIVGALLTVSSEGKSDRLEKGKNAMVYAIIGLIIALMSFIIVKYVESILF